MEIMKEKIVSWFLGSNRSLKQISTTYISSIKVHDKLIFHWRKPILCWHLAWGDGMLDIWCNNYGISLYDLKKWREGNWSKIKQKRFKTTNLLIVFCFGETEPYNPTTGKKY